MAEHSLLVPFLNQEPTYCYGVELGMQVLAPMLRKKKRISGYFVSSNEEQIRLCCYRLGYEITELETWVYEGKETEWVWMVLKRREMS